MNIRKVAEIAVIFAAFAIAQPKLWAISPATPFISPATGTYRYTSGLRVTISDVTPGVAIYYTTDGSTPTVASTVYSEPFTIPSQPLTETVRALATLNRVYSSVTSATFTIAPQLAEPTLAPAPGYYLSAQRVTISTSTPGGVVHYTTDGSIPTANSPIYSSPISVTGKVAIKAIVTSAGYTASGEASRTYAVIPATPFLSPASGTYPNGRTVNISDATAGVTIYYTTNGSAPSTSSSIYNGPITLPPDQEAQVVRALAVADGVYSSDTSATYIITPTLTAAPGPVISPASGVYTTGRVITISDALDGATIFYTTDGTTPTLYSTRYIGPFNTSSSTGTEVVQAIAVVRGYQTSAIARARFALSLPSGVIASTLVLSTPTVKIATNFLGFSHEWTNLQKIMGSSDSGGTNTIYQTLVRTLTTNMDGPLVLRIGGGSTDTSGVATPATVAPLVDVAQQVNVKFILGVNLGSDNLNLAKQQAATFTSQVASNTLMALEIGNEPDGYATNGYRSSTYSYSAYLPQFDQWSNGVSAASTSPVPMIAGPVFGTDFWIPSARLDLADSVFKAGLVTQHLYPGCYNPADPLPNNFLLQPTTSTLRLYYVQPYAATAHQAHSIFRLAEMNSVCDGGQPGLSDSFSSALWGIDTMFEDVNAGIDGVNWNTASDGGPYDLFQFNFWNDNGKNLYGLDTVRPLYYGLLFFSQAAGKNAELLPASTVTNANVKVWATADSIGKGHLVIINKDQTIGGNVQLTLPGYSSGSVVRLAASNYLATSGVTIGGQTYDNSPDGTLQGSPVSETIYPASGVWTVSVNPTSAVLVNLEPSSSPSK